MFPRIFGHEAGGYVLFPDPIYYYIYVAGMIFFLIAVGFMVIVGGLCLFSLLDAKQFICVAWILVNMWKSHKK